MLADSADNAGTVVGHPILRRCHDSALTFAGFMQMKSSAKILPPHKVPVYLAFTSLSLRNNSHKSRNEGGQYG